MDGVKSSRDSKAIENAAGAEGEQAKGFASVKWETWLPHMKYLHKPCFIRSEIKWKGYV